MTEERTIPRLRSRLAELATQEASLLSRAFELRAGGSSRDVDALFARIQAIHLERNRLKTALGKLLGSHRLHVASEVWQPGLYSYRREIGSPEIRVRVSQGPLGLQVQMPGRQEPLRLETVEGIFEGPVAADGVEGEPREACLAG